MATTLKERIAKAEQAAETEESPLAAIFRNAKPMTAGETPPPAVAQEQIYGPRDLPADALDEMDQPFRLYNEEKLEQMRQSIVDHGIIQRVVVRPSPQAPGRYQIISGRNRRRGAMLAGYTIIPCEVRDLDDDKAELLMLETNLQQRDDLLPSEKAWAYRRRLETLNRQGRRTDLTLSQFETKLNSAAALGKQSGESRGQVFRYIRLTYLLPPLLVAVDDKRLGFSAAGSLSYLSKGSQEAVYQYFFVDHPQKISGDLAEKLRGAGQDGDLDERRILQLLSPNVERPKPLRKVSVAMVSLRKFFPPEKTPKEIEREIIEIVTKHFEMREH